MSRKKKTIHYAIVAGRIHDTEIVGITDREGIARKYSENFNRINQTEICTVVPFIDFKELGDCYLSPHYSENNFYICERKIQIDPSGKIESSYDVRVYPRLLFDDNYSKSEIGVVENYIGHYIEKFTMILSRVFVWAPNEEAARAEAYRAFEKNQFEVLKDYLENSVEK